MPHKHCSRGRPICLRSTRGAVANLTRVTRRLGAPLGRVLVSRNLLKKNHLRVGGHNGNVEWSANRRVGDPHAEKNRIDGLIYHDIMIY
jgi:hypothetical protein